MLLPNLPSSKNCLINGVLDILRVFLLLVSPGFIILYVTVFFILGELQEGFMPPQVRAWEIMGARVYKCHLLGFFFLLLLRQESSSEPFQKAVIGVAFNSDCRIRFLRIPGSTFVFLFCLQPICHQLIPHPLREMSKIASVEQVEKRNYSILWQQTVNIATDVQRKVKIPCRRWTIFEFNLV